MVDWVHIQNGFIKGRQIKDCICIPFEAINMLSKSAKGSNISIKIDIYKAFDSLCWDFLLQVLHYFGFHPTFINWICVILQSVFLSIRINGNMVGYFSCRMGIH